MRLYAAATLMLLGSCGGDRSTTAGYAAPKTLEPAQGSVDNPGVATDPPGCPRCAGTYTCPGSSSGQGGGAAQSFALESLSGACVAVGIDGQGSVVVGCDGTLRQGQESFGTWSYEPSGAIQVCTVVQYYQGGQPNGGPTTQSVCSDCVPASPLPTPAPAPTRPQPGAVDAG